MRSVRRALSLRGEALLALAVMSGACAAGRSSPTGAITLCNRPALPSADAPDAVGVTDAASDAPSLVHAPRVILPRAHRDPDAAFAALAPDGPCASDSDCTITSAPPSCGPCGGCHVATTRPEAARREHLRCAPYRGPPVDCEACGRAPARALCLRAHCIGILDPRPTMDPVGCASDDDCALVAFDGCCACPTSWHVAAPRWIDDAERFCASQPCLVAPTCNSIPARPGTAPQCVSGSCRWDASPRP